jgi:hypothetical protein
LAPGTYVVTAVPHTDYELVGYPAGGWNLEVLRAGDCIVHVTAAVPTATDQTAGASGFITVPTTEGVAYSIDLLQMSDPLPLPLFDKMVVGAHDGKVDGSSGT